MGINVQHFPAGKMVYSELSEYYQDNSRPIDAGVLQECWNSMSLRNERTSVGWLSLLFPFPFRCPNFPPSISILFRVFPEIAAAVDVIFRFGSVVFTLSPQIAVALSNAPLAARFRIFRTRRCRAFRTRLMRLSFPELAAFTPS